MASTGIDWHTKIFRLRQKPFIFVHRDERLSPPIFFIILLWNPAFFCIFYFEFQNFLMKFIWKI